MTVTVPLGRIFAAKNAPCCDVEVSVEVVLEWPFLQKIPQKCHPASMWVHRRVLLRLFMARVAAVVSNGCAPDPRVLREARWLVEAGHEVTVHAFDRLEALAEREEIDGVSVVRHRVGYTPYGGTISTVRGLRRFRKSVVAALASPSASALASPSASGVDLVHCHDADTLSVGLATSGAKVLFDMHDLHHTWVLMPNPRSLVRKMVASNFRGKMLARASKVDAVVTSSCGFQSWLAEQGIESEVVENRPAKNEPLPPAERFTVGYLGRVREVESFELLLDALKLISDEARPHLIVAGDGTAAPAVASMVRSAVSEGWLSAEVFGAFDDTKLAELMAEISVMYAMYPPARGNIQQGALPVKMFDAASFGRPSVVNSNCHMGEVCESELLGRAVPWGDSSALASALVDLAGETVQLPRDSADEKERFLEVVGCLVRA
jgi:glycosyltransferase involved in cell wall biosynthesis